MSEIPWVPKPGDITALKSGGPPMTVICVVDPPKPSFWDWIPNGCPFPWVGIHTVWFDEKGNLNHGVFTSEVLQP